jgi:hypothetical protein
MLSKFSSFVSVCLFRSVQGVDKSLKPDTIIYFTCDIFYIHMCVVFYMCICYFLFLYYAEYLSYVL